MHSIYDDEKDGSELRSIEEIKIDVSKLESVLTKFKDKITKILFRESEDLQFKDYNSFKEFLDSLGIDGFEL